MDHLQMPVEENDANWRDRCNKRMKRLKNIPIPTAEPTEILQERLSLERKKMIFELCTSVQNKNADTFVDKMEEISAEKKLSFANILDQVTHIGNSLLHVAAYSGADEIGELIAYHFPELLTKRNIKGDTPLHVAARAKDSNIVKMILSRLKNEDNNLTRLKNEYGNTALHEAVYANHFETVSYLFEADKPVAHHLNKSGKSALYIAVVNLQKEILDLLFQAPFMDKPLAQCHGISPLHAAISIKDPAFLAEILHKNTELLYLRDGYGGTPLHYAASTNYLDGIRKLLEKCSLLALEYNTKGYLPIHIACKMGHVKAVKELLTQGSNARDFLDQRGRNILHIAAKSGEDKVVKYLLKKATLEEFTINEKDRDGNTALHLATKGFYPNILIHLAQDKRVDVNVKNNEDFTAYDLIGSHCTIPLTYREFLVADILVCAGSEKLSEKAKFMYYQRSKTSREEGENWIKDRSNTFMLIAILIATVTFAAGITVPGSVYSSDDPNPHRRGLAVLANKTEFQIFIICNTIAMFGSTIGCTVLLKAVLLEHQTALKFSFLGSRLVNIALWAMYLAFVFATRLVVSNVSWLANLITIIAGVFLTFSGIFGSVVGVFPTIVTKIPQLRPLYYFILIWIYIPLLGRFGEKITKKHDDTKSKRLDMAKEKDN